MTDTRTTHGLIYDQEYAKAARMALDEDEGPLLSIACALLALLDHVEGATSRETGNVNVNAWSGVDAG